MRTPFRSAPARQYDIPEQSATPQLHSAGLAAKYRAARVGGDFFDFALAGEGRLLFVLMDIAGKREQALHVAAAAQRAFRKLAHELENNETLEEADAVTRMALEINKAVITSAGKVICAPAFMGVYQEDLGVLTYINAGHMPGVVKDGSTSLLEPTGIPLGLFSHSTHDAQYCALSPGGALLLVSRGVVEARGANQEMGIARVREVVEKGSFQNAEEICNAIIHAVQEHERKPGFWGPATRIPGLGGDEPNDVTTLALMRNRAGAAAAG